MNKAAIICAMPNEMEAVQKPFIEMCLYDNNNPADFNNRVGNTEIVCKVCGIGKINAAMAAMEMIIHHKVDTVIMFGVAGALNPNYKIADLLVGNKTIQGDVDLTTFGYEYGAFPNEPKYVQNNNSMIDKALEAARKNLIPAKTCTIASVDKFVERDSDKELLKTKCKADLIDMESASVSYVCDKMGIDYVVFRTVSDTVDGDAQEYEKNAERALSANAGVVLEMLLCN